MIVDQVCPGCGLVLPPPEPDMGAAPGASAGCWAVQLEVAGFEAQHPAVRTGHQLLVDAYGAQHAASGSIRLPYSLIGLHLALESGWTGPAVRLLHGRMGKPRPDWPAFERPGHVGSRTVLDVAEAGARSGWEHGHTEALHDWATDVWSAWSDQHAAVAALAARVVR